MTEFPQAAVPYLLGRDAVFGGGRSRPHFWDCAATQAGGDRDRAIAPRWVARHRCGILL